MNHTEYTTPKITLVGAGPGDIELITLKGINALKTANVVLFDALVNKELLEFAPKDAVKIYVGKRNHQHAYSQDQINSIIVEMAIKYGHVVRLKGGDSFVFGRGQEELNYARLFNIETSVVPGISSSISVPALAGIPVTHRGVSESFWVITGTTKDNQLSQDVLLASKTNATVVILMGLGKLKEIADIFVKEGKANTAIALIQDGSLPTQKVAVGTINTIIDIADQYQIKAPAVIVIGEVVEQHQQFEFISKEINVLLN
ncbi:MAG: uroporphyrinogen-III C-methyltransferase [Bacteroidetes bacterium]|nr:uroporphyrinogen-III C-methyltransferase [Bacteroidota bacterium]